MCDVCSLPKLIEATPKVHVSLDSQNPVDTVIDQVIDQLLDSASSRAVF